MLVVVAAILLGTATGWVAGAPNDATTTTTTTTAAATELPSLPPDFVDTGLGSAASVAWMFTRGPDLLIGVAVATPVGAPPTDLGSTGLGDTRRGLGIWTVQLSGGEQVDHTREMFDPAAPGIVTIEFAGFGASTDAVRSLTLRPAVGVGTRVHNVSMPLDAVPAEIADMAPLEATELVEQTTDGVERRNLTWVTIDLLTIDWRNAAAQWTLDDPRSVRAIVDIAVMLEGETTDPVGLISDTGGAAFLQRASAPVSPTASGITMLRKQQGTGQAEYVPERADMTITVSWLRYSADDIEIPLDNAVHLDPLD